MTIERPQDRRKGSERRAKQGMIWHRSGHPLMDDNPFLDDRKVRDRRKIPDYRACGGTEIAD